MRILFLILAGMFFYQTLYAQHEHHQKPAADTVKKKVTPVNKTQPVKYKACNGYN